MQIDRSERFRKWLRCHGGADAVMRICRIDLDQNLKINSYADIRSLFEEDGNFPPVMLTLLEWLWNEFRRSEPFYNWD